MQTMIWADAGMDPNSLDCCLSIVIQGVMMKAVSFARHTPVPQPPPGWHALAYAITLDGQLGVMWADCDVRALHEASRDKDGA